MRPPHLASAPARERWSLVTAVPPRVRPHVPMRPLWLCRACAGSWPCATARLTLLAEYADSHVALSIYLAGMLYDAIDDLYRLNPHGAPTTGAMFDWFLGWAPPRPILPP